MLHLPFSELFRVVYSIVMCCIWQQWKPFRQLNAVYVLVNLCAFINVCVSVCVCKLRCLCWSRPPGLWPFVFEEGSPASQSWPQGCHGDKRSDFLNSWPIPRYIIGQGAGVELKTGVEKREESQHTSFLMHWLITQKCINDKFKHQRYESTKPFELIV